MTLLVFNKLAIQKQLPQIAPLSYILRVGVIGNTEDFDSSILGSSPRLSGFAIKDNLHDGAKWVTPIVFKII